MLPIAKRSTGVVSFTVTDSIFFELSGPDSATEPNKLDATTNTATLTGRK